MSRRTKRIAIVLGCLALVLGLTAGGLYYASRHVPQFYEEALAIEPVKQTKAARELGSRVTTLYNDTHRAGAWQAIFKDEEINGWLAVDLAEKHPDLLPQELQRPRVHITPNEFTLAARYDDGDLSAVVSLAIEPFLYKPNVLGFRVRSMRAGALPLPMADVLSRINEATSQMDPPLAWTQMDGDPVALMTIVPSRNDQRLSLDRVELREGEIFFSGTTMPLGSPTEQASALPIPLR